MNGSYTCIFGGGAVRGLAYVGAIRALKELGINVKTLAGSSVGSIVAAFLAVGYDADEIKELFMQVNFELFKDIRFGINKEFAISKGNVFTDWVRESIETKYYGNDYKKGENPPVTFGMLSRNLVVLTTDLNSFNCVEFSNFETPDYEVASAIRISCSMPGLMPPVEMEDCRLVDGDLLKGIPLWRLSKNINCPDCRVLEFRLEGETVEKDGNPLDFFNSIYSCMTSASTDFIIDVFGDSWDRSKFGKYSTFRKHPNVTVEEGIQIWRQSKLSLNIMSWHKAGFTERMANIMLAGAVLITDWTGYLEGRYHNDELLIFDLDNIQGVIPKIKKLLHNDQERLDIATKGLQRTLKEHTWEKRAKEFLELLRQV